MHDHLTAALAAWQEVRARLAGGLAAWLVRRLTARLWRRWTMTTKTERFLGAGEVASRIGCDTRQVIRIFERGLVPAARRAGRVRIIPESDLPAIREAAVAAGYLPAE
jgi:hypothetical protein